MNLPRNLVITRSIFRLLKASFMSVLLPGLAMLLGVLLSALGPARTAYAAGEVCFASLGTTTEYSSTDQMAVQQAVNAATSGQVVKVAGYCAGVTETLGTTQTVLISGTALTLRGSYTTTDWSVSNPVANLTVLDAQSADRVVLITATIGTVENISITRGSAAGIAPPTTDTCTLDTGCGSGIYAHGALNLSGVALLRNLATGNGAGAGARGPITLIDSELQENRSAASGGGLYAQAQVIVDSSSFYTNTAPDGAGLFALGAVEVDQSDFLGNSGANRGGGIATSNILSGTATGPKVTVTDTVFTNNAGGSSGGGISALGGSHRLLRVQFIENNAGQGGGIAVSLNPSNTAELPVLNVVDSQFLRNGGGFGAGLYARGTVNVTASQFISNTGGIGGGAAIEPHGSASSQRAIFNNTQFEENSAGQGGGLSIGFPPAGPSGPQPSVSMTNTDFVSNTASAGPGGAVLAYASVTLVNGSFVSNTAISDGGGLYVNWVGPTGFPPVALTNVQVISNTSGGNGGGIYAPGVIHLLRVRFEANSAKAGGGLSGNPPSPFEVMQAYMTDTQFISNSATSTDGGGATVIGHIDLRRVTFERNSAVGDGGGLYAIGFSFSPQTDAIEDSHFISNTSTGVGGGLLWQGAGFLGPSVVKLDIARTEFISNTAILDNGGGAYLTDGGGAQLTDVLWRGNQAGDEGGALFTDSLDKVLMKRNQVLENSSANGGALYVSHDSGSPVITCFELENSAFGANTTLTTTLGIPADIGVGGPYPSCLSAKHNTFVAVAPMTSTAIAAGLDITGDSVAITNTIFQNYSVALQTGAFPASIVADYALFDGVISQANGAGITVNNAITGSADFADPVNHDYRLKIGSAALDTGLNVGVTEDFEQQVRPQGPAPDLGYDEGNVAISGLVLQNSSPTRLTDATAFTASVATGSSIVYTFNFGDGTPTVTGTSTLVNHIYATTGSYTAMVTASNFISTAVANTLVTVTNQAPVAKAGPDQTVSINGGVVLIGLFSSDPDGHLPLSYHWAQTGGPAVALSNATSIAPTFTAPSTASVLTFTLVVTDNKGLISTPDTVVVTVKDIGINGLTAQNSGPTVLGQATTFSASVIAGSGVTYTWFFGDGSTGTGITATHTYTAVGSYVAYVQASNSNGSVIAQTVAIVIAIQRKTYLPLIRK